MERRLATALALRAHTEIWAAAVALVGVGVSAYGISQQHKDNQAAQTANQAANNQQNSAAWGNYLMTRGIAPTSPTTPGVLPTAGNYQVVNSRLPLWATLPKNLQGSTLNYSTPQTPAA